jgi:hypothetical protein
VRGACSSGSAPDAILERTTSTASAIRDPEHDPGTVVAGVESVRAARVQQISDFAISEWRMATIGSMLLSRIGDPRAIEAPETADLTRPATLPRYGSFAYERYCCDGESGRGNPGHFDRGSGRFMSPVRGRLVRVRRGRPEIGTRTTEQRIAA